MTSYEKIKALAEMVQALMHEMDYNFSTLIANLASDKGCKLC